MVMFTGPLTVLAAVAVTVRTHRAKVMLASGMTVVFDDVPLSVRLMIGVNRHQAPAG